MKSPTAITRTSTMVPSHENGVGHITSVSVVRGARSAATHSDKSRESSTQQHKSDAVRHTPMDLYVKEYLLRAILVAFDQKDTKDDVWDMALVSPSWKMYCDGFGIEFIKEKTDVGFLVTMFKDDVHVNRRDDENGISTKLNDEANEVVRRYIRSCYKPTQSPATPVMKMAVMFYAGKEVIVSDVEKRVFKEHVIDMLVMHGISKDRNVDNYRVLAVPDKIVTMHTSSEITEWHNRHQHAAWTITDSKHIEQFISETDGDKCSMFCNKLIVRDADSEDHSVFI